MAEWAIEQLADDHERGEFSCGKAPLDRFIREQAGQFERRALGRTYVAVLPGGRRVVGYYTLAAGALEFARLPTAARKKLPKHPVPVILLGRLAVDQSMQGRGLGADLLIDAFKKAVLVADTVGAYAIFVEAIDESAHAFYVKYGFIPLADQERHLFLPMATVRAAVR